MSKYKKCKLLHKNIVAKPGTHLRVYGHHWIIQPNGDAIADIHVDFHEIEVASGRYMVLDDKPEESIKNLINKQSVPKQIDKLAQFTMDISTYYGAGDLKKLENKIRLLKNEYLAEFANTRFNVTFPPGMSKSNMIIEIIDMVKLRDNDENTNREDAGIENMG